MDVHFQVLAKYIISNKTYLGLVIGCAFCLGYWHGMRPGEYSIHPHSSTFLKIKNQYFGPKNRNPPKENIIHLFDDTVSKTNKIKRNDEFLAVSCTCKKFSILPCSTHWFISMFLKRKELYNGVDNKEAPLLMLPNGKPIKAEHITNMMHATITFLNKTLGLNMSTEGYAGHSLRIGSCTDKMCQGWTPAQVKKWGRCASDIWHSIYQSMNLSDFGSITGKTLDSVFVEEYEPPNVEINIYK